jgi:hypothetical protein
VSFVIGEPEELSGPLSVLPVVHPAWTTIKPVAKRMRAKRHW